MAAILIDGKAIAGRIRSQCAQIAQNFEAAAGRKASLAVVLVGGDPASEVYVRAKIKASAEAGMLSAERLLDSSVTQAGLLEVITALNEDAAIDGILVQLPLPKHIDPGAVIAALDPRKDVDGFHPENVGKLAAGAATLVPCTPLGCVILLQEHLGKLAGLEAVVLGRSSIVGKPMAQLLLAQDCTVTIAHSRTRNLAEVVRRGDIVIAAVGRAEMVKGEWLKPGSTVIDVGINRVPAGEGKTRLVGDVDFASAREVAGAITPVPGGVGPMTIAILLRNTLIAAHRTEGLPFPEM